MHKAQCLSRKAASRQGPLCQGRVVVRTVVTVKGCGKAVWVICSKCGNLRSGMIQAPQ